MNAEKILATAVASYPVAAPAQAKEIVEAMVEVKSRGMKLFDKLEAEFGCTYGFFDTVKEAIKEENAALNYQPRSAADARIDRMVKATSGRR